MVNIPVVSKIIILSTRFDTIVKKLLLKTSKTFSLDYKKSKVPKFATYLTQLIKIRQKTVQKQNKYLASM